MAYYNPYTQQSPGVGLGRSTTPGALPERSIMPVGGLPYSQPLRTAAVDALGRSTTLHDLYTRGLHGQFTGGTFGASELESQLRGMPLGFQGPRPIGGGYNTNDIRNVIGSNVLYSGGAGPMKPAADYDPAMSARMGQSPQGAGSQTLAQFYSILNDPNLWSGMQAVMAQRRRRYQPVPGYGTGPFNPYGDG